MSDTNDPAAGTDPDMPIYRTGLSNIIYAQVLFWIIVAIGLAVAEKVFIGDHGSARAAAWLPIIVAAGALVIGIASWLKQLNTVYEVAPGRISIRTGILSRSRRDMIPSKISDVSLEQSLFGRLLGYGDVLVADTGGATERFQNVDGPDALRQAIRRVAAAASR